MASMDGNGHVPAGARPSHPRAVDTPAGIDRAEERARELAREQSALREVATLVALEATPVQLFAVVAEQVAQIFDVPHVGVVRYEQDSAVVVGSFSGPDHEPLPVGSRWSLDSTGVIDTVRRTRSPARVDYDQLTGEVAANARAVGMRSAVASPIDVEGHLWGAMVMLTPRQEPFPDGTEARLVGFPELVATAIANAESREAREVLTEEQAALRRVATLVARGAAPRDLFAAVTEEVARL